MRRWMFLPLVMLMCCGESDKADPSDAATQPPTPVSDGGIEDAPAPVDGATADGGALTACVERPTDLPRPPTGRLPCELIPPGLTLGAAQ